MLPYHIVVVLCLFEVSTANSHEPVMVTTQ